VCGIIWCVPFALIGNACTLRHAVKVVPSMAVLVVCFSLSISAMPQGALSTGQASTSLPLVDLLCSHGPAKGTGTRSGSSPNSVLFTPAQQGLVRFCATSRGMASCRDGVGAGVQGHHACEFSGCIADVWVSGTSHGITSRAA